MIQTAPEDIDGINARFWDSLHSGKPTIPNAWVDVRDVAEAHLFALNTEIVSGTEFILSAPAGSWERVGELVRRKFPSVACNLKGPIEGGWTVDTTAAERILGMQWRGQDEMVEAVLGQQLMLREAIASL